MKNARRKTRSELEHVGHIAQRSLRARAVSGDHAQRHRRTSSRRMCAGYLHCSEMNVANNLRRDVSHARRQKQRGHQCQINAGSHHEFCESCNKKR